MDNLQIQIGIKIREFRNALGYSIEELSHKAGLNPSHLGKIERGERNFTIGSLEKILNALYLTPAEFFSENKAPCPSENYLITKTLSYLQCMTVEEQEHIYKTAVFLSERQPHKLKE
ncbi:helix-turn-helix transcriptional regulator [Sinanaerobacter sp. ZZT-01]|uniref:helix-turn-helix domain-containing protein n=1 Tax=Sinanaerobacter sp. ZZT-01 TaxID=3111540 RepID=UPI002D779D2B|nr:helix-turn-helix transcriptional regulator [Sinanaerobacter sp. ZZT-01]WRR94451.1 helix-turn-helix transcriptional regulator [Sinanaerobacter sp. ZZT-01]